MRFDKFTTRAQEVIEESAELARKRGNGEVFPEHLAYALVKGPMSSVIKGLGKDPARLISRLDAEIARLPKVFGDSSEIYISPPMRKVLSRAEDKQIFHLQTL